MSFYTSLSGLKAAQTNMSTISHNIANASTNGFKKSSTEFADVIASSVSLSPTQMVGSGAVVKANRQQFGQGNLVQSANALDLAISGDGFFAVKPNVEAAGISYTRNGGFMVDTNRYVVDGNGGHLQVYPVDGSGAVVASGIDQAVSLRLPETSGVATPTTTVKYSANLSSTAKIPTTATFDRFDPSSYNQSTQQTVYDASGNPLTMTSYFKRETAFAADGTGTSTWSVHSFVGDQPMTAGGDAFQTLAFDTSGDLTSGGTTQFDPFTPAGSGVAQQITLDFGTATTQLASPFNVASRSQNGAAVGQLQGVTVDGDGLVKASFSNGDVQNLGKVALVNFSNPSGLRQTGGSYWSSTGQSGEPLAGVPGEGGLGKLMSGTIERSNVDITEELVALIAAQQNFQANAKALDTASKVSETIFNIR